MKYELTGYVQLAGKPTAKIRTVIEAGTKQEAEAKFTDFLLRKTAAVVVSCQPAFDFGQAWDMFKNIFK